MSELILLSAIVFCLCTFVVFVAVTNTSSRHTQVNAPPARAVHSAVVYQDYLYMFVPHIDSHAWNALFVLLTRCVCLCRVLFCLLALVVGMVLPISTNFGCTI